MTSSIPDLALFDPTELAGRLGLSCDRVIETSCAWILLCGDQAIKLKKPVDYGFLDFTSPEKRRVALRAELRLNARTASDIYQAVTDIDDEPVLLMRRFDPESVLDRLIEAGSDIPSGLMTRLGASVAAFHAKAEVCDDPAHLDNLGYVVGSNAENIALFRDALGGELVDSYEVAIRQTHASCLPALRRRFEDGFVRLSHGDLHLGNILIEHDMPVLFDCIEFNDRLNRIDVLYDIAFLLMDLCFRGRRADANAVFNVWLEIALRLEDNPLKAAQGLELLFIYMSVRAAVRCHVNAHAGKLDVARNYLVAAMGYLRPETPSVLAIGGLSGTGKSTRARSLAPDLGPPPGAVIIRSDEVRKRLHQAPTLEPLAPAAYTPEATAATLSEMCSQASAILGAGRSVVLDATFRDPAWRQAVADLADRHHVGFEGLWLSAPADIRAQRVALRTHDVSDATPEIARGQTEIVPDDSRWRVISATEIKS